MFTSTDSYSYKYDRDCLFISCVDMKKTRVFYSRVS